MQPVVILLVSGVIMFSVIGGLSLLAHYYTLNGIKSKTVGDGPVSYTHLTLPTT